MAETTYVVVASHSGLKAVYPQMNVENTHYKNGVVKNMSSLDCHLTLEHISNQFKERYINCGFEGYTTNVLSLSIMRKRS